MDNKSNLGSVQKRDLTKFVTWYLFSAAIVSLLLMFIFDILNQTIIFDELATLNMVSVPFKKVLTIMAPLDTAPPFYHLYLKVVSSVLSTITPLSVISAGKLGSLFPMVALVVVAFTKVSKNWGKFCGAVFAFCVTAMPQMHFYGIQMRPYALAMFFVTMSFLFAYETAKNACAKNFILFFVFTLLSAYTHYYASVAVGVIYIILAIWFLTKKKYKALIPLVFLGIGVVAALLPWLLYTSQTLQIFFKKTHYLSPFKNTFRLPSLKHFSLPFKHFISPFILGFPFRTSFGNEYVGIWSRQSPNLFWVIYLAPFFIHAKSSHQKENHREFYFAFSGIFVLAGIILAGLVTSNQESTFCDRFMFPSLGCFWLSFAIAIGYPFQLNRSFTKFKKTNRVHKKNASVKKVFPKWIYPARHILIFGFATVFFILTSFSFVKFQVAEMNTYRQSALPYKMLDTADVLIVDDWDTAFFDSYYSKPKSLFYTKELPTPTLKRQFAVMFPDAVYAADDSVFIAAMQNNERILLSFTVKTVPQQIIDTAEKYGYELVEMGTFLHGMSNSYDHYPEQFTLYICTKVTSGS